MPSTMSLWYTVGFPQMCAKMNSIELNDEDDGGPKFLGQAGRNLPQAGFQFFYMAKLRITGL